jgi:4-amino-4-deoxy-L-arabinose transferase-like glycosyltransferase
MTNARGIDRATLAFLAALLVLTGLRIFMLRLDLLDLYFDEAQYWAWSRSLELGYYSKPPLVAWVIAATTALFGDGEWAVRLGAPLAHAIAAGALFALGRSLYGAWAGFWAGLGWMLIPGVSLSANVISTDALMLPLWSLALLSMWRLAVTRAWSWAVALGVCVGLGTMAKYAMLYFPFCVALAAWWCEPVRAGLREGRATAAALIALALIAPNLWWNFQNGFVTAQHTAANADINLDKLFNPGELLDFLRDQAGVIGPLLFIALIVLFWRAATQRAALREEDKFLLAFILPTLLFVSIIAFVSRANANWAAAAYPAAVVWLSGRVAPRKGGALFLAGATALNAALFAVAASLLLYVPEVANQTRGLRDARGWEETAREIALRAMVQPGETPFTAVMVDDRQTFYELGYYWRHARRAGEPLPPVRMWLLYAAPGNSAEMSDPMRPEEGARVLVVHAKPSYLPLVADDFTLFRTVEHLTVPLGGGITRNLEISVGEGFAPAPRDEDFMERVSGR